MALLDACTPAPRRILPVIFLVDGSNTWSIKNIEVHETLKECLSVFNINNNCIDDVEPRLSILQYNSSNCITSNLCLAEVDSFDYINRKSEGGGFRKALIDLDSKLSRNKLVANASYEPLIIWLVASKLERNWTDGLFFIQKNNWFKYSQKVAININNVNQVKDLSLFTGTEEAVIDAKNSKYIIENIWKPRFVS